MDVQQTLYGFCEEKMCSRTGTDAMYSRRELIPYVRAGLVNRIVRPKENVVITVGDSRNERPMLLSVELA